MLMCSLTLAPLNIHGVVAALTVDGVAAVAGVPDEGVVAGAAESTTSLPRPPMMVSLPSPPSRVSLPSPPVMVSLPAPPSTVMWMSGARPLPAVKVSSPPFMLTTRFSVVPMSRENGAGLTRSKRTRVPLGVTVKFSAPLPPLTWTVSMPSPPSLRSVPSPGFQIMRSLPASPKTWSLPAPPVRVSLPSPPKRRSSPPLPSRMSLPAWPKSRSLPEPPIRVSLPSPPKSWALGSAPLVSSSAGRRCRPGRRLNGGGVGDGGPAGDGDRAAVDEDCPGGVAANGDVVVLIVAEYGEDACCRIERCRHRWQDAIAERFQERKKAARHHLLTGLTSLPLPHALQPGRCHYTNPFK